MVFLYFGDTKISLFKVLSCLDECDECELKLSPSALGQSYSETDTQSDSQS